ncbi:hypothetical protein [Streptomyces longwoodensis]|uniref:hypothetical protein n=1 Tax=Streptomyces longwoodensis TaxID=68231 RepID=UPI0034024864
MEVDRHRHGRPVAGLQDRAAAKLAEIDAKINDLTAIRTALAAAVEPGRDDLTICAESACCPIHFTGLAKATLAADSVPIAPRRHSGAWPPWPVWRAARCPS